MSDETKGILKFWGVFGGLIIIVVGSAFLMSSRMAVTEEKVRTLELKEKRIEKIEEELKDVNSLLIEINANQKMILKKLE